MPDPELMVYSMSKNILVSEDLLCDVYRLIYFLIDEGIPDEARKLCISIEAGISDVIRRREIRTAFTAYKTAPPGSQRDSLRQVYIKLAEIHNSFISEHELPNPSF